ncbi:MAG: oligosaccharide flippase family protein [Candidatus Omnitrophica bacterium]|nr:oligosaccharide flippase family protein [Candidatus Omnitrophota bacterium]
MSITKRALRGAFWTAIVKYFGFFITFIGNLWLARLLVPEDFGIMALALSVVEIIFIVSGLGIAQACIHLQREPDVFDTGHLIAWGISIGLSVIAITATIILQKMSLYSSTVIIFIFCIAVVKILSIPTTIYLASLDRDLFFRRGAFISIIGPVFGILIALFLAINGRGVWSLLWKQIVTITLAFLTAFYFSSHVFRLNFNKSTAVKIIKYSINMFLQRLAQILNNRLPNIILGAMGGTGILGFYERSKYLAQLQNSAVNPFFGKIAFATYSKVKNNKVKVSRGLELNLFWILRIGVLTGILVLFFPKLIIATVLGSQWAEASEYLRGLSGFIIANSFLGPLSSALFAAGIIFPITLSRIIATCIVLVGLFTAWYLGDKWFLVSWFFSLGMIQAALIALIVSKRHKLSINWAKIIKLPVYLTIISVIVFLVSRSYLEWKVLLCISCIWILSIIFIDRKQIKDLISKLK